MVTAYHLLSAKLFQDGREYDAVLTRERFLRHTYTLRLRTVYPLYNVCACSYECRSDLRHGYGSFEDRLYYRVHGLYLDWEYGNGIHWYISATLKPLHI